jgi:hypothetical protein
MDLKKKKKKEAGRGDGESKEKWMKDRSTHKHPPHNARSPSSVI